MIDTEKRKIFTEYLDLLLKGKCGDAEWQFYVIEHYLDEKLEEIRREVVRLRIVADDSRAFPSTNADKAKIKEWIEELS